MSARSEVTQFFETTTTPPLVAEWKERIQSFVALHHEQGRRVAIVTSGGTTVPLEKNTVRFLDNFSEGRRGSSSAEEFLKSGYAVIFLYRKYSLQPFTRRFMTKARDFLDYLILTEEGQISVQPQYAPNVKEAFKQNQDAKSNQKLLEIPYISVIDYLFMLRETSQAASVLGTQCIVYLAAAVSDFYLPESRISEHKIQSKDFQDGLHIHLDPMPKMLGVLSTEWAPQAFVISFKLETLPSLLEPKARGSLDSYGHQVVIGNLLSSHQDEVFVFSKKDPENPRRIARTEDEKAARIDIETRFIPELATMHSDYASSQ